MTAWWFIGLLSLAAAGLLTGAGVLWADDRKRRRRAEQRIAYRATMRPGWAEKWAEVEPGGKP